MARLVLIFAQHNVIPTGGHRSEPFYFDLWLIGCILSGRKVNLGYLMVQQMSNLLTSTHDILPYGMVFTLMFRACGFDLSAETDVRMPKPFDAIDNACITRLGYEFTNGDWREKVPVFPMMRLMRRPLWIYLLLPLMLHLLLLLPLGHPRHLLSGILSYHNGLTALPRITHVILMLLRLSKPLCSSSCALSFLLRRLSSCFSVFDVLGIFFISLCCMVLV